MRTIPQELILKSVEVQSGSWEGTRSSGVCTCGHPFEFTEYWDTTPSWLDSDRMNNHELVCNNCGKKLGTYDSCMYL